MHLKAKTASYIVLRTLYRLSGPHPWKSTATSHLRGRRRTEFTAKLALRTLYAFAASYAVAAFLAPGVAAMAAYDKPTLVYFNILGRGEPIRMTFAACGVEYDEESVPYGDMKGQAGSKDWPFGQAPVLRTQGSTLTQMTAIMRYVAARFKPELLGTTLEERATVDALLEGIDDLYLKYIDCVYSDQLSPPARDALWAKHFNPMTAAERNGGGHLRFIDGFLERSGGPFLLGSAPTIADLFLFFALEAFSRDVCFGNRPAQIYPRLGVFQEAVADLDGLKERLGSSARASLSFNGNGVG